MKVSNEYQEIRTFMSQLFTFLTRGPLFSGWKIYLKSSSAFVAKAFSNMVSVQCWLKVKHKTVI